MSTPKSKWLWFGTAAHFCCGRWCRFHLATKVGKYLISTMGEFVSPRNSGGSEVTEGAWLKENYPGEDIGYGRKYETFVFRLGKETCPCGCGLPVLSKWSEIDSLGANDAKTATENHRKLCDKWSKK
jgi:hypothetical protein